MSYQDEYLGFAKWTVGHRDVHVDRMDAGSSTQQTKMLISIECVLINVRLPRTLRVLAMTDKIKIATWLMTGKNKKFGVTVFYRRKGRYEKIE